MKLRALFAACALTALSGAAAATTIGFDALPGDNGDDFNSYSESGFDVTRTAGDAFVATVYGNPVPDVFFGPLYGSAGTTLEVTFGSGTFTFGGFDLAGNGGAVNYTVTGLLSGLTVFSYGGSYDGDFVSIGGAVGIVDTVSFDLTATGTSANIDNIVVDAVSRLAVPEPATWAMMIGGFCVAGAAMRRRPAGAAIAA